MNMTAVDKIEVFHVAMPLRYPWRTAYGEDSAVHSILVHISSNGDEGWGEACPLERPAYSPEWAAGAFALVRDWLAPTLIGAKISEPRDALHMLARFKGNHFAKAAVEMAFWSLYSARTGRPLHTSLGGTRSRVEVGADFGVMDRLEDLIAAVDASVTEGYRRVKLKFRPGWDVEMVKTVRSYFPDLSIHVDCNAAYTIADEDVFTQLDGFDLRMIEQPLGYDDLLDHAKLQARIDTPICLDESITSVERTRAAVELASCRIVNIKPGRVGGLSVAVDVHDICANAGIECWVGGNLESAIGSSHAVALATLPNFTYPADIFPTSRMYEADLASPEVQFVAGDGGGRYAIADGIVRAPDLERLRAFGVEYSEIGSLGGDRDRAKAADS
jgi:O-succinylbenzoate synthase